MSGRRPSKTLKLDLEKAKSCNALLTTPDVEGKAIATPEMTKLLMGVSPSIGLRGIQRRIGEEFAAASRQPQAQQHFQQQHQRQQELTTAQAQQPSHVLVQSPSAAGVQTVYALVPQTSFQTNSFYETESESTGTPIDMDVQETVKLGRKRERNRLAAQRCRQKKLSKIDQLELELDSVKRDNFNLEQQKLELEDFIQGLQVELKEHKTRYGCVITVPDI